MENLLCLAVAVVLALLAICIWRFNRQSEPLILTALQPGGSRMGILTPRENYVGTPYGQYPGDAQVFQQYPYAGPIPGFTPLGTWRGWQRAPCEAGKVSVEAIVEARRAADRALEAKPVYNYMPPQDAYNLNGFGVPYGLVYDLGANT